VLQIPNGVAVDCGMDCGSIVAQRGLSLAGIVVTPLRLAASKVHGGGAVHLLVATSSVDFF
jgi:hypothetical protein